jgi:hypothetical protein
MKVSVELQKRGFCVSTPHIKRQIDWDALVDALLDIPNVHEVDGPEINGCVGVTYDNDDRSDAEIVAELRLVFARF